MDNKVGDRIPSDQELAALIADITSLKARVAQWGVHLAADERQGTSQLRAGAAEQAPRLAELARKHSVQLKGIPLDGMVADLALLKVTRPLEQAVEELAQLVADTRLEASTEAAQAFYAYYNRLSQMCETDPELASEMAPILAAMVTRRRKK